MSKSESTARVSVSLFTTPTNTPESHWVLRRYPASKPEFSATSFTITIFQELNIVAKLLKSIKKSAFLVVVEMPRIVSLIR